MYAFNGKIYGAQGMTSFEKYNNKYFFKRLFFREFFKHVAQIFCHLQLPMYKQKAIIKIEESDGREGTGRKVKQVVEKRWTRHKEERTFEQVVGYEYLNNYTKNIDIRTIPTILYIPRYTYGCRYLLQFFLARPSEMQVLQVSN